MQLTNLNKIYLNRGYYDATIMQYKDMLQSQGFNVELEKTIQLFDGNRFNADLYASKDGEKRLYEFKLVGNGQLLNSKQRESVKRFKEIAAAVDAKPFMIYVNPPKDKDIEIEGLETGLYKYMITEPDLPPALSKISPDAKIVSVHLERINNVNISTRFVTVDGDATIYVKFPSAADADEADGNESFLMSFKAVFVASDNKLSFMNISDYHIDTSDWYGE